MSELKQLIAAARDVEVTPVEVPEWGTVVHLKQLNVSERISLMDKVTESNTGKLSVFTLLFTLCDQDGVLVFGADDYELLAAKNARVIDRLGHRAAELNRMVGDAIGEAKNA